MIEIEKTNHIENGDEKCSDGNCYKLKSTFKKRQQHFAHRRGYREQIHISKSNIYFAPVVCNLFKGIQNKCISTCMSKKCTQKEFGNPLEYIALGNQCKNVKRMF